MCEYLIHARGVCIGMCIRMCICMHSGSAMYVCMCVIHAFVSTYLCTAYVRMYVCVSIHAYAQTNSEHINDLLVFWVS